MARFEFRLRALLKAREATRDARRVELAQAQAADRELQQHRAALESELGGQQAWLRLGAAPGRLDIDRLRTADGYDLILRRELRGLAEQQQALAGEIERRREDVVAADREVRVLEKLRKRQHQQFRQQQALAETKELDEVAARAVYREPS
jgi:flagellar protein FliJ